MEDRRATDGAVSRGTATVACDFGIGDSGLEITEVRISPRTEDKLKAFVSVTLNRSIVIRGIKIIEGRERLFVAMPSRPKTDGSFQDIVHPINQATRQDFEDRVLSVYYEVLEDQEVT
jgi:stage V sporulation protein G